MESPPTGTKFAIHAGAPFERFSVCVQGRGRGTGEAGEPLQTADGGTTLAGFKYLRGAAPLLDSYGLTWKTTGPDDLVPTPRPTPKVVLVRPLYPRFVIFAQSANLLLSFLSSFNFTQIHATHTLDNENRMKIF